MSKNNRDYIISINKNQLRLTEILNSMENQLKTLRSDVECIKSYISQQEEIKQLKRESIIKEEPKGWFNIY